MKVINADLGAFLRRNENLEVSVYFKNGRFYAATASVTQHATNLADALEHVHEEYRRRNSGMQPIRDNGKGTAGDTAHAPAPQSTTTTASTPAPQASRFSSISQAGQQTYQQQTVKVNGVVPSCPTCGLLPDYMTGTSFELVICKNMHKWPANDGGVYVFENGERYTYMASGSWLTSKWIKLP